MNAIELLELCEQYEVSIEIADREHIAVEPIDRLPIEIINQLKRHKLDIIQYLNQQQPKRTGALSAVNDAHNPDSLPIALQRALKGFHYLLEIKHANLASKGHTTTQAAVKTDEYKDKLIQVMGIDHQQASDYLSTLIQLGHIERHGSYLYGGNGLPRPVQHSDGLPTEYLPADASGQAFINWLYGSDSVH